MWKLPDARSETAFADGKAPPHIVNPDALGHARLAGLRR